MQNAKTHQIKAVIFDWDGTLVDSEAHIVACIGYAAKVAGLPELSYDERKNIIGLGLKEALLKLYPSLTEPQILDMRKAYSDHFFSHITSSLDLFAGVTQTLEALKEKGYRLAVATGKSRNGLSKALESSGLGHFFEIERCADETKSKPHPLMLKEIAEFFELPYEQMLMVGDTTYDMEMARAIEMPRVAVSYGVHDVAELEASKPAVIIDEFPSLLDYFK